MIPSLLIIPFLFRMKRKKELSNVSPTRERLKWIFQKIPLKSLDRISKMKPYTNLNGKSHWSIYWGDKAPQNIRRIFKKSARQMLKKDCNND